MFVLDQVASRVKEDRPLRCLCICSSGETAIALLSHPRVGVVDAVDVNRAQLFITELKLKALLHLESSEEMRFFLGSIESTDNHPSRDYKSDRLRAYDQMLQDKLSEPTRQYWQNGREYIANGIMDCGRNESWLRNWRCTMRARGLDPWEDLEYAIELPLFRKLLLDSIKTLRQTWGIVDPSFTDELVRERITADTIIDRLRALCTSQDGRLSYKDNYHLSLAFRGTFALESSEECHRYPLAYMEDTRTKVLHHALGGSADDVVGDRLRLREAPFHVAAKAVLDEELERYDFITLSNISDFFLNDKMVSDLYRQLSGLLSNEGGALLRKDTAWGKSLSHYLAMGAGDHQLMEVPLLNDQLEAIDRSLFSCSSGIQMVFPK